MQGSTVVFTMGRVGSRAVHAGLLAAGCEAHHVHYLNPTSVARQQRRGATSRSAQANREALEVVSTGEPVRVVTLVRDSIDRNLSAGWALLRHATPREEWAAAVADRPGVEALWGGFHQGRPAAWFDSEMLGGLGVDVYDHAFPVEGHLRVQVGQVDLLIMRSTLDDLHKGALVTELVGHEVEVQHPVSDPERDDLYARFRAAVPLTEDAVRQVARTRYQQHFFGEDEDAYVQRWANR